MFGGANMSCVSVCVRTYLPTAAFAVSWLQGARFHSPPRVGGGSGCTAEGDTSTAHLLQQAPPPPGMDAVVPLGSISGFVLGLLLVVLPGPVLPGTGGPGGQ